LKVLEKSLIFPKIVATLDDGDDDDDDDDDDDIVGTQ